MDNRLPEKIKKLRKEHGYKSQYAFAQALHVHEKTVQYWETGKTIPTTESLIMISQLFNVDLDYLTEKIQEPTHDLQFVCDNTGLSVDAVMALNHLNQVDPDMLKTLSQVICTRLFPKLIHAISALTLPKEEMNSQYGEFVRRYLISRLRGNDAPYMDSPEDIIAVFETQALRMIDGIVEEIKQNQKPSRKTSRKKG